MSARLEAPLHSQVERSTWRTVEGGGHGLESSWGAHGLTYSVARLDAWPRVPSPCIVMLPSLAFY